MINIKQFMFRASLALLAVVFLGAAIGYADVKNDKRPVLKNNGHPGLTGAVRYSDTQYTLTCWQEGKQVMQNQGVGNISLSREFVGSALSISAKEKSGPVLTIFSTDTALCRLQTGGRSN